MIRACVGIEGTRGGQGVRVFWAVACWHSWKDGVGADGVLLRRETNLCLLQGISSWQMPRLRSRNGACLATSTRTLWRCVSNASVGVCCSLFFSPQLYKSAHNAYKMTKQWQEAGVAAQKMAECYHPHLNSKGEAASAFQAASTCFQKVNPNEAVACLTRAVELYVDEGRFQVAAKQEQQIGELLEEMGDMEQAITHYQTAADYFDGEGQASAAAKVKLKVADWCALNSQYARAIEIYEATAIAYLANNLLKWSAKELFFKAGLCHLASEDLVAAKRAVERYNDLDVTFSAQREYKFLTRLIEACEKYNADQLTHWVKDYNALSPLDTWKIAVLNKIKNSIASPEANEDLT